MLLGCRSIGISRFDTAGVVAQKYETTVDGNELTFQVPLWLFACLLSVSSRVDP